VSVAVAGFHFFSVDSVEAKERTQSGLAEALNADTADDVLIRHVVGKVI
jgi:hypothetical protein